VCPAIMTKILVLQIPESEPFISLWNISSGTRTVAQISKVPQCMVVQITVVECTLVELNIIHLQYLISKKGKNHKKSYSKNVIRSFPYEEVYNSKHKTSTNKEQNRFFSIFRSGFCFSWC